MSAAPDRPWCRSADVHNGRGIRPQSRTLSAAGDMLPASGVSLQSAPATGTQPGKEAARGLGQAATAAPLARAAAMVAPAALLRVSAVGVLLSAALMAPGHEPTPTAGEPIAAGAAPLPATPELLSGVASATGAESEATTALEVLCCCKLEREGAAAGVGVAAAAAAATPLRPRAMAGVSGECCALQCPRLRASCLDVGLRA